MRTLVHRLRLAPLFACLLVLLAAGCAGADDADDDADLGRAASPIVGGMPATTDQLYGTVALVVATDPTYACSGTLIAPTVVVTAAHCVYQKTDCSNTLLQPYNITVVAGALNALDAGADLQYEIATLTERPDYICPAPSGLAMANDIAVIVLTSTVKSLSPVAVFPFDSSNPSALPQGTPLTIEGYGSTDGTSTTGGVLFVAQTPYQQGNMTEFIAGGPGSPDACGGDSGGPAYIMSAARCMSPASCRGQRRDRRVPVELGASTRMSPHTTVGCRPPPTAPMSRRALRMGVSAATP
jgi:secreted trypsin-like serine protease